MKLTEQQRKDLIADYQNGMSWNNLCKKYHVTLKPIHNLLKKNNIEKKRMQGATWSEEKKELLRKMYLDNCTYQEMYEALNCKGGTLTYWVHKLGLPMRGSGRNSTYPNKFKEHTIESDYWLGYIFADGHISYSKRQYTIILSSEKKYVIDKYIEWYNNIPSMSSWLYTLKDGTQKTLYSAIISSKDIASWFINNLGVESKKHHTLNPDIEINWDIIRGFFDGDGSSSNGSWQLKSCSKVWLERIQSFLEEHNIKSNLKISYKDCWGLYIYDNENLRKIVPLMYEHKYFCHQYKYDNFEPLISND